MKALLYVWASFLLIAAISDAVSSQRIPLRSNDPAQLELSDAEMHVGSKMLPDGMEIVSYLRRYRTSRYYFMIEEDKTPVEMVITPCDSLVTVKIFIQNLPLDGSGLGQDDYTDDLLRQFNNLARHPITASQPIKEFSGSDVMRYKIEEAQIGVYIIEALTLERDSSVRMSVSTLPFGDLIYPELPRDPGVTSRQLSRSTVELSWKPSPSAWRHGHPIDYCIVVNRRRHYRTHCAAQAATYGDQPPTAPPDVGFQFAWQRKDNEGEPDVRYPPEVTESEDKVNAADQSSKQDDMFYRCTGNKTRFVFNEVIGNGVTYYFDVFAIDRNSNTSATYAGTQVVARNEGKSVRLKDGKLMTIHLKRTVLERTFLYHMERKSSELTFQVHPCSGQINVTVKAPRGATIQSLPDIRHLETIVIKDPKPGQYVIHVSKNGKPGSNSFRVFASTDPSLLPYPVLPKDTQLQTFEKINTCNSVTVAWMGTGSRQKYCLYVRPVTSKSPARHQDDRCVGHIDRPRPQKLLCRYFRAANDKRSVMTETVRKLKPGATYEFTVYAVKKSGTSLPFENLVVKTKEKC